MGLILFVAWCGVNGLYTSNLKLVSVVRLCILTYLQFGKSCEIDKANWQG